jgi:RNA polymerase sigma-70 factor (ECF subfamily)
MEDDHPIFEDLHTGKLSSNDCLQDRQIMIQSVYEELRSLANSYLSNGQQPHTLQPTAIVHEAFLRISKSRTLNVESRTHFFRIAAVAMRHVLVDHAKERRTSKRGGGWNRVTLSGIGTDGSDTDVDTVDINEALIKLEQVSPRQAQVVELRFFGGLQTTEIANLLELSGRTVSDDWRIARAWLRSELDRASTQ